VGPRSGLKNCEERTSCPCQKSSPCPESVPVNVLYPYSLRTLKPAKSPSIFKALFSN